MGGSGKHKPQEVGHVGPLFVGRRRELGRLLAAMEEVNLAVVYGVPGVGKSTFLFHAGALLCEHFRSELLHHRCRQGETLESLGAALVGQARELGTSKDAFQSLSPWRALEKLGQAMSVILCLDDVQNLEDQAVVDAVTELIGRRTAARICMASRELLALSPTAIDYLVIHLRGFDPGDARELWEALGNLYGPPSTSFDRLFSPGRSAISPLALKQFFANPFASRQGDSFGLGGLDPSSARLLGELCAHRHPVPVSALSGEDASQALGTLSRRFLVEPVAGGMINLHDLVRDAVMNSSLAPGPREHRRAMEHYQELTQANPSQGEMDDIRLELLHHAVSAGEDSLALELLEVFASQTLRWPVGRNLIESDLARALDAMGERCSFSPAARILRARIRIRAGDPNPAYSELEALASENPQARVDLGELAYCLGHLSEAERHYSLALADPSLGGLARISAWMGLVDLLRCRAEPGRARQVLGQLAMTEPDQAVEAVMAEVVRPFLEVLLCVDEERYSEASDALAGVLHLPEALGFPIHGALLSAIGRLIAVARGLGPEREECLGDGFEETTYFRLVMRLVRAQELLHRGEPLVALEAASGAQEAASRISFRPIEAWAVRLRASALLMLGRPQDALSCVGPALETARACGHLSSDLRLRATLAASLLALGRLEEAREVASAALSGASWARGTRARLRALVYLSKAMEMPPGKPLPRQPRPGVEEGVDRAEARLARVEALLLGRRSLAALGEARSVASEAASAGWRHIACQAALLMGEASFRLGDLQAARLHQEEASAEAAMAGYGVEAVHAGLLEAALARAAGGREECQRALEDVISRSVATGLSVEAGAARVALSVLRGFAPLPILPEGSLAARLFLDEPVSLELMEEAQTWVLAPGHVEELDRRRYIVWVDLLKGRVERRGKKALDLRRQSTLLRLLRTLVRRMGERVPVELISREVWDVEYHPARHQNRMAVAVSRLRGLLGLGFITGDKTGYVLRLPAPTAILDANDTGLQEGG